MLDGNFYEHMKETFDSPNEAKANAAPENESVNEVVKAVDGGYAVFSHEGKKLSRVYPSKKGAEKRLGQIEYFKHKNKSKVTEAGTSFNTKLPGDPSDIIVDLNNPIKGVTHKKTEARLFNLFGPGPLLESKGHHCDNCEHPLEDKDYTGYGSWSYTCPECGFKYASSKDVTEARVNEAPMAPPTEDEKQEQVDKVGGGPEGEDKEAPEEPEKKTTPGDMKGPREDEYRKEYFGSADGQDKHLYFIHKQNEDTGAVEDLQIIDVNDRVIYSAKEQNLSIDDEKGFLKKAAAEGDLVPMISTDLVLKYDLLDLKEPKQEEVPQEDQEQAAQEMQPGQGQPEMGDQLPPEENPRVGNESKNTVVNK
jgi:hypothetical protein